MLIGGGHIYDDEGTSNCENNCGAWMGRYNSGAPDGIDPFGECPKASKVIAMKIVMRKTARGFDLGEFRDSNDEKCSIQKSSIATDDLIWLGLDEGLHHEGACLARMHLDQERAAALIPLLQRFIETGELS